ncbi:M48 family metallopeptidase [Pseudothauera lacus]|uniref:Peptidase M48 domain-containing protein n=1 Tax=Pseudothauera lacus TaxID=2136175 RepID=A0A2T4IF85_9RHOO|nr:M48 family metallopeptidase [Pseudothauera lacus]PTD96449.1 hypothetical protein C8261_09050 [Pseudothauera lacus]
MDFFAAQDHARRASRQLVGWFAAAVVAIILVIYLLLAFVLGSGEGPYGPQPVSWWQPELLLATAVVVGGFILLGSLYKILTLASGGGAAVAEALGGRLVPRATTDALERRLVNVVDEMAIAAGIPAPPVYVLDGEQGINAFAAGTRTTEGVVAVTRGTLEQLSRDELQGVIAHEFSHILNGDMRLNLRLIGVLHGILLLTLIGRILARSARGSDKGAAPMIIMGLVLIVVGYVGVLFGKIIKAAVSRQREFLADAAAVQFTRNPAGIAGALQRIAGHGSAIGHPRAEEASHMFFGSGMALSRMFATHPPLDERIRRIDPSFRGAPRSAASTGSAATTPAAAGFAGSAERAAQPLSAAAFAASVGTVRPQHVDFARRLLAGLPPAFVDEVHHPAGAQAAVFALLLAEDATIRTRQLDIVRSRHGDGSASACAELRDTLRAAGSRARLPILDIAIPALREPAEEARRQVLDSVDALIRADGRVSLFEYALQRILHHALLPPRTRYRGNTSPTQLHADITVLLSLLARAGHGDASLAEEAFAAAARQAPTDGPWTLLERAEMRPERIDQALDHLAATTPPFRARLIEACATAVMHDGQVNASEFELLRVVCEALDCPVPPLTEGA